MRWVAYAGPDQGEQKTEGGRMRTIEGGQR